MAFHAQNATMISSIVRFEKNFEFLSKVLCDFDPAGFLVKFQHNDHEESVIQIVESLRFNKKTHDGLKWDSTKSKEKNKDSIVKRYANTLLDCAEFVNKYSSKKDFLDDLLVHYPNGDFQMLIEYFRPKVKHGFSVALTCGFLKEFDNAFRDLPKPDIHVMDTLCALNDFDHGYYKSERKQYECIREMQHLVNDINNKLPDDEPISVYQLDRMIWLICSENFYLDIKGNAKSVYLRKLCD